MYDVEFRLGCRNKANCLHVGLEPTGGSPPWGGGSKIWNMDTTCLLIEIM